MAYANHMILIDQQWNGDEFAQLVGRIRRYDQKKNCYIYRIYAENTIEQELIDLETAKYLKAHNLGLNKGVQNK